jgi:hypothetical protein
LATDAITILAHAIISCLAVNDAVKVAMIKWHVPARWPKRDLALWILSGQSRRSGQVKVQPEYRPSWNASGTRIQRSKRWVSCNLLLQPIGEISVASGQSWQMFKRPKTLMNAGFGQHGCRKPMRAKGVGLN